MTAIYGHRGAMGTHPENTLESFAEAIRAGVEGIELDVQMTSDGHIVVIHDATVDRTTNGTGSVHELTLEQVKKLDAGGKFAHKTAGHIEIPTLKEVLELITPYEIELNIELKPNLATRLGIEKAVLKEVAPFQETLKVIYSSFHLPLLIRLKEIQPEVSVALLLEQDIPYPSDYLATFELETFHLAKAIALRQSNQFQQAGLMKKVRVWTVNQESEIKELLQLGVAAIMTDFPAKAVALRNE
ncbi:glycerophosphoryl diester phosphodiesterase [Bacillus sp. JCM 19045]|nr:glycerophosphoryl diester phosphodiesterase [Bacillus sp. JCM 19045]